MIGRCLGFDMLSWTSGSCCSGLEWCMDRKSHAARTVPAVFHRWGSRGSLLCGTADFSASAGLPARRGVCGAKDSPHLQNRVRNCFSARSRRAGISVCGQVFLLNLDPEEDCYEEHQKLTDWRNCCAHIRRSGLGVAQNRNPECLRHDLCSVSDNGKESARKSWRRFKGGGAIRKETGSGDLRRCKNQHGCASESHNRCGLSVATREGRKVSNLCDTCNNAV